MRSKLKELISKYYSSVRERAVERGATTLLSISTLGARRYLKRNGPLRILIDTSVIGNAVTHETGWISTGPKMWGNIEVNTGYMARIPVHSPTNKTRMYQEIRYLPGIAHLARHNFLKLFTSGELQAEAFSQPAGRFSGYGWYDYNVFKNTKIETIDDAFYLDLVNPKQAQQTRLKGCQEPLFLSLVENLGESNNQDAFHIFTAEKFGLDVFLCLDFPLVNKIRSLSHKLPFRELRTKVMLPSDLASLIRQLPFDTNLHSYVDSSVPRRADLHMPGEQRRPRKDYKDV
ncbi:hypothetical protein BH10PSE11_BH10PSE11_23130 [soil metagenome]